MKKKIQTEDLLLGPYKLPLRKLKKEEGFGYFGAISLTTDNGIQCHVCGAIKENLSLHIRFHDMTVRAYKEKFGLSLGTRLISESMRNKLIVNMHNINDKLRREGRLDMIRKKALASQGKRTYKKSWLSPEDLNKKGICPDQLLETIHAAYKHYGRTPSYAEYMGFHQTNRFWTPIKRTFGTWKHALEKAGYTPRTRKFISSEQAKIKYTDEELIEIMEDFARDNHRPPSFSDFKRGFLPTWETYTRHFGSMQEARKRAGLTEVLKRGGSRTPSNLVSI